MSIEVEAGFLMLSIIQYELYMYILYMCILYMYKHMSDWASNYKKVACQFNLICDIVTVV